MNQDDKYCHLSDLHKSQCHHCVINANTLGPIDGGLYLEEWGEEDAAE